MAFGLGSGYALQHCSLRSSSSWSGVEGPPWNKLGEGGQLMVLVLMPVVSVLGQGAAHGVGTNACSCLS